MLETLGFLDAGASAFARWVRAVLRDVYFARAAVTELHTAAHPGLGLSLRGWGCEDRLSLRG